MITQLSVNLNKIALLRNARGRDYPSVLAFSRRVLRTDAIGITLHPRPDQRHARHLDIHELAELLIDYPGKELNIEGYPTDEFMQLVLEVKPHQCTLVPDDPNQITSDHGWDLHNNFQFVKSSVEQLNNAGIRSVIFMDPNPSDMELACQTGANRIELYTETYAESFGRAENKAVLARFQESARAAQSLGMGVNAGHDLNLMNLELFLLSVMDVREVSIGHAITVESLDNGFDVTLQQYLHTISRVSQGR